MTKFELLPAELQIEIFSYLQALDLKAARAVSRKFRDNATPMLFRSILACARYPAMGAFQKISLHSIYPTYVKEVVFDGSVYEADLAQNEHIYDSAWSRFRDLPAHYWEKRGKWKKYQTAYREQEDMKASGVLLQTIARGLEWMENVSSIVYSPHQHLLPAEVKDIRDVLPTSCPSASLTTFDPWIHRYTSSEHAFRHLIGAIYISKHSGIRELRVEPYHRGTPGTEFSLPILSFPEAEDFRAAHHLFRNLTKLELNMTLRRVPDVTGSSSAEQLANLAELVAAAADLRHLALHISQRKRQSWSMYGHIFPDGRPIFPYLGLEATWPKLRSFSLKGIYAHEQDITDLIRRHKDTLRSIVLKKCSLTSGCWAEVVDEVVFNSAIPSFVLDRVDEKRSHESSNDHKDVCWRYEGHLIVSNGDRNFVDTNSDKKSVYDLRREI